MSTTFGTPPANARLPKLYVSVRLFERQCRLLQRIGMRGVSLSEGLAALRAGQARGLVALTFDDGYLDNVTDALPILRNCGFTATCFVVAGHIADHNAWDAEQLNVRKPLMDPDDIALWRAAGNEIGSHTLSHPRLTTIDDVALARELTGSKALLERLTGAPVRHLCYPYGDESAHVREAAAAAGYESAVSTRRGIARSGDDAFALPRISINGDKGLLRFALKVATPYAALGRRAA
ncbi:MAG: polysaccharide deacetylase family protein [Gammaproteobacteria bacterium]|nr:polysaccharide deacetylase family protein [Gammaproteobacteria bacterium]